MAQLVERCTGIAEVMGSNPVQAWIFFRLNFRNCLSCVYHCDDLSLIYVIIIIDLKLNVNIWNIRAADDRLKRRKTVVVIFRLSFRNCLSYVNNCEGLSQFIFYPKLVIIAQESASGGKILCTSFVAIVYFCFHIKNLLPIKNAFSLDLFSRCVDRCCLSRMCVKAFLVALVQHITFCARNGRILRPHSVLIVSDVKHFLLSSTVDRCCLPEINVKVFLVCLFNSWPVMLVMAKSHG